MFLLLFLSPFIFGFGDYSRASLKAKNFQIISNNACDVLYFFLKFPYHYAEDGGSTNIIININFFNQWTILFLWYFEFFLPFKPLYNSDFINLLLFEI